jgi:hypothetical protein
MGGRLISVCQIRCLGFGNADRPGSHLPRRARNSCRRARSEMRVTGSCRYCYKLETKAAADARASTFTKPSWAEFPPTQKRSKPPF